MKKQTLLKSILVLILFSVIIDLYTDKKNFPGPKIAAMQIIPTMIPTRVIPSPQPETINRTSLIFTGDINLGRCIASASIRASDYTYPFKNVAEKLSSADITIGSLDGSLSNETPPEPCPDSMNLIGPEDMVQGLQLAGFDVITIATNHVKDCGEEGFLCGNESFFDTIRTLSQAGIRPVGGGANLSEARKPVIIEKQGIRFAFLGIDQINKYVWATENSPGVAPLSSETIDQIKADIISAKAIADVVIVMPQWGTEYSKKPDEIQRQWAQEMMDAGATLIIGNHPHIIQPMETFSNGTTFYALGNFVFDQGQNSRREGLVVQATFKGAALEDIQLLPVDINYYTHQPNWTEDPETQKILMRVPDLSQ